MLFTASQEADHREHSHLWLHSLPKPPVSLPRAQGQAGTGTAAERTAALSHCHCLWLLLVRMSGDQRGIGGLCCVMPHVTLCHATCGMAGRNDARWGSPA